MIVLRLPVPPSTNALFYNRKKGAVDKRGKKLRGRGRTAAYRKWLKEADGWYMEQKRQIRPIRGPCSIQIRLPKIRGDLSNRIKAAEDFLVSREITGDDRHNFHLSIHVTDKVDCCEITIAPHNGS